MTRWSAAGLLLSGVLFASAGAVHARGFTVYGYGTPAQGEIELVYLFDHVLQSGASYDFFGTTVSKEGLSRHTVEVEYGVTDRWTIAGYLDFEDHPDADLQYAQLRALFARYRLFEPGQRFFDSAVYLEYYIPNASYDGAEKLEARLIFEKAVAPLTIRINPIFEKNLSTVDVEEGVEFEYAAGLYAPATPWLRVGLEGYGALGEISNFNPWDLQEHYLFPAVKARLGDHASLDVGLGVGLTEASDDLLVKTTVGYEF
jgi:hypothetical protein